MGTYRRLRRSEPFEGVTRNYREPEKRLMLAVLHDAVVCLKDERAKFDARSWIMAEEKGYLFCFESICEVLDWNADKVRNRLLYSNAEACPTTSRKRLRKALALPPKSDSRMLTGC